MSTEKTVETLSPMQQELLNRADSIFTSVSNTVGQAASFAKDQVPDIAMQYVAFGRAQSTVFIVLFLVLLLASMWLIIGIGVLNLTKIKTDSWGNWGEKRSAAMFVGIPLLFIGFIGTCVNMSQFLMVWFAPKVWLILEMAQLVARVRGN